MKTNKTLSIKQHDLARKLTDTLTIDGEPIDLNGAVVSIVFQNEEGGDPVVREATITDATGGQVEYQFVDDDTTDAGTWFFEWEIVFGDAAPLTVPDNGYYKLIIMPDLG